MPISPVPFVQSIILVELLLYLCHQTSCPFFMDLFLGLLFLKQQQQQQNFTNFGGRERDFPSSGWLSKFSQSSGQGYDKTGIFQVSSSSLSTWAILHLYLGLLFHWYSFSIPLSISHCHGYYQSENQVRVIPLFHSFSELFLVF